MHEQMYQTKMPALQTRGLHNTSSTVVTPGVRHLFKLFFLSLCKGTGNILRMTLET